MSKTAKQLDREIAAARAASAAHDVWEIRVRSVYSRSAQMPTVSGHIAVLSPLHGRDVVFKRDTLVTALQAALKYAAARGLEVKNRRLIETRLERLEQDHNEGE